MNIHLKAFIIFSQAKLMRYIKHHMFYVEKSLEYEFILEVDELSIYGNVT